MLVSASVTAPKVANTTLVDIPRNSSGYENSAAVGAMVKWLSSHSRLPTPESRISVRYFPTVAVL